MDARIGRWRRGARTAALLVAVAVAMAATAVPAAALTPNGSLFLAGGGRAETGVLKNGAYTRKRQFSLGGVNAAAATRSSLALYTKGTGKLRTGTFRGGIWKQVETITVRSGFTHAVGSCDSLLLYNSLSGRAMSGTLIGGRFRNSTSFFLPTGLTALASSCDTTWFSGPASLPAVPPSGMSGTLSGGDWTKTGDIYASPGTKVGMNGTTFVQFSGSYVAWGSAKGGELDGIASVSDAKVFNIITGAANTMLFYQSAGYACTQMFPNGVAGAAICAPNIVTSGWKIIAGGR